MVFLSLNPDKATTHLLGMVLTLNAQAERSMTAWQKPVPQHHEHPQLHHLQLPAMLPLTDCHHASTLFGPLFVLTAWFRTSLDPPSLL